MSDIQIIPTGGALGAEARGLDLRQPLSPGQVNRLRAAFLDHGVLFFRDQRISEEDQVRFSRYFGDPAPHVREQPDRPIQEIFIISNVEENGKPIGALGNDEINFHSDLSYMPRPGSISMLYAVEVPESGGDTMWANCCAAYEALDEGLKGRIAGLRAIHKHPRPQQNPPIPASHPVVRTHPETGRKVLYVSPHLTSHIEGASPQEDRELLDRLIAHATQPRFVWAHKWRVGDLLMWDNRCTMHRRESFDNAQRRIMKRTQMFGDEPY
ncbi:TauD/TfdA family dioxygenase [bacterium]|nr:TauD/TfdA family dioxygenase [bacterium]